MSRWYFESIGLRGRGVVWIFLVLCAKTYGQGRAEVEGAVNAKGVVLLRATVPGPECPRYMTIVLPQDDGTVVQPGFGLPRGERYFLSKGMQRSGECSLLVLAFASLGDTVPMAFVFSTPGEYKLRWSFGITGVSPVDASLDQTIRVMPPMPSDRAFLARLAEPAFLRHLFGRDLFESAPSEGRAWLLGQDGADHRALIVIGELLEATRFDDATEPMRKRENVESALRWAEVMLPLAQELPDSSYAPYAAFYAGCGYVSAILVDVQKVRRETGISQRDGKLTREDWATLQRTANSNPSYEKARGALQFAVDRADDYLKPLALYMKAFLDGLGFEWEDAARTLDEANAEVGIDSEICQRTAALRRDLELARERYELTLRETQGSDVDPRKER